MIMAKHTVDLCPVDVGKPFAFKVDAGEGIPMYVAADSDEMANRWLQLLRQAASQDNQWLDKRLGDIDLGDGGLTDPFSHITSLTVHGACTRVPATFSGPTASATYSNWAQGGADGRNDIAF